MANHGGPREGAGRKQTAPTVTVRVDKALIDYLKAQGKSPRQTIEALLRAHT